jgi:hypothetical protein
VNAGDSLVTLVDIFCLPKRCMHFYIQCIKLTSPTFDLRLAKKLPRTNIVLL